MRRLRDQGVEQFGRNAVLVSGLHDHLSFLDHMHEFDLDQDVLGCIERFKPQHRPRHALNGSMVLFDHLV